MIRRRYLMKTRKIIFITLIFTFFIFKNVWALGIKSIIQGDECRKVEQTMELKIDEKEKLLTEVAEKLFGWQSIVMTDAIYKIIPQQRFNITRNRKGQIEEQRKKYKSIEKNELKELLIELKGIEYTKELAENYLNKALPYLDILPDSKYKGLLKDWANFMIDRKF